MLERVVADLRKEVEDLKKAKYKAALPPLWDRAAIFIARPNERPRR